MRIVEISVLFTVLFIARGKCRPEQKADYLSDPEDYDDPEIESPEPDLPPAHINTSSRKLLVRIGQDVQLPCNVTNSQSIAITWRRGSTPLYYDEIPATTDNPRIIRRSDNSLIIHSFMESDVSDDYICEISSTPPERVVHSVRTSRNVFILPSGKVEVNGINKEVKLACQANWEPKPKVEWYLKGKKVPSDSNPADGSSLTIRNVSESNAGRYQCLVESTADNHPTLYKIYVNFYHAPRVEVLSQIVHAGLHMESEMTCEVDAYPYAIVTWLKNGKPVTIGRTAEAESTDEKIKYSLRISRTGKSDFGKYTCEASNSVGKSSGLIELTGAPAEPKFNGVEATPDSKMTTLKWQVESSSPIIKYELKYRRKGEKDWKIASPRASDDGTGNMFEVRQDLEGLGEGDYETVLIAQNEFGWSPEPDQPHTFNGSGSKSGAASVQYLLLSRSILLVISSLLVCTTYL